jgi:hypothetical protein
LTKGLPFTNCSYIPPLLKTATSPVPIMTRSTLATSSSILLVSIFVLSTAIARSEFKCNVLHADKAIPTGGPTTVHVRPLEPGRYNFFDDFRDATQGYLNATQGYRVVP